MKNSRNKSGSEQNRSLWSRQNSASGLPREMALPMTTRSGLCARLRSRVAVHHLDLPLGEERGHGRIHVLVRAGDGEPVLLQRRGRRRHRRPADADKVN